MGKDVYFNKAKIIVNDWWVVTPDRTLRMDDVLSTQIVDKHYKVDWGKHIRGELAVAVGVVAVTIIVSLVRLPVGGALIAVLLVGAMTRTVDLARRSVESALVLNTRSGPVEIAGLNDTTYTEIMAKEINCRIAEQSGRAAATAPLKLTRHEVWLADPPPEARTSIDYRRAKVRIMPDKVTLGNQAYPIENIWRAEVRNEGQPMSMGVWLRLLLTAVVLAVVVDLIPRATLDVLSAGVVLIMLCLVILVLVVTAKEAIDIWKRASKYALIVEGRDGYMRVYTSSNKLYMIIIANSINRAIREHARKLADGQIADASGQG